MRRLSFLCGDPVINGLEGGVGVGVRRGRLVVGGQVGMSSGDHRDDRPVCRPFGSGEVVVDVVDNRSVEVDLAVFFGVAL